MCRGRDFSKWSWRDAMGWKNLDVCIEKKYRCDGVVHCKGEEDEINCDQKATKECIGDDCDKVYRQPGGEDCKRKQLMCRARDGRWAGWKICLEEKFKCDNHVQCEDGSDEEDCEEIYKKRRIFPMDHHHICRSPFLNITGNKAGKFFPMRGVR